MFYEQWARNLRGIKMNQEEYATLDRIRTHFIDVLQELEYLGKLPRIRQNLEFDLHELEVYIEMMREMSNAE